MALNCYITLHVEVTRNASKDPKSNRARCRTTKKYQPLYQRGNAVTRDFESREKCRVSFVVPRFYWVGTTLKSRYDVGTTVSVRIGLGGPDIVPTW
jgi:hypothetical protein